MKKRVLITGSNGFIFGNFIRKALHERKDLSFIGIDKISKASSLNNLYLNKDYTLHIGDIADEHFVNTIFEFEKPEIIIHAAAESAVDESIYNPNKFIQSNVLGTQVILNAAVKHRIKKFLFISTDETTCCLSNDSEPQLKENAPLNPKNSYAASKAAGEMLVKATANTFGLNFCITRSSNNYGPWQTAEKFIPRIIKCILNDKPIPVYGQGLQMRDWMHVHDNCAAISRILDDGKSGETYNISANQEFSNIEVVNHICNIIGKGHELISYVPDRPGHDFRYGVNSDKIKETLGWKPQMKFKDGITKTVEWYLTNKFVFNG